MLANFWSDLVRHPLKYGVIAVLLTVVALFVWAIYAPLDQGVVTQGVVKVTGSRKTVQALVPGKVVDILVKDGQLVQKDAPLLKLDDTNAKAQLGIVETQFVTSLATEARLHAEREQKNELHFPKELNASNPIAREAMSLQQQLFNTRRQSLKAEVDILHKNIEGLLAQQRSLKEVKSSKEEQLKTLKLELESIRDLAKDGFVPKTRMFELERNVSAINAGISDDIGQIARLEQDLAERRLQIIRRTQEQQKEVETQLAQVTQDVAVSTERMRSLQFELDNVVIVAPLEGTVVQLAVHTPGAVLQSGTPILDLVPRDEPLIIEAQIPTHLIDKVKVGNDVQLRFSAFNHVSTPTVDGRLTLVSADSVVDQQTKSAFYSAQITINQDGLKVLKNNKIVPGMPVDVIIKTGERSLMNYFLKPLQNRISSAMKEE